MFTPSKPFGGLDGSPRTPSRRQQTTPPSGATCNPSWAGTRPGFRVRLRWDSELQMHGLEDSWAEVPEGTATLSEFADHIMDAFVKQHYVAEATCGLLLSLDGFRLTPETSVLVLRDSDLIDVGMNPDVPLHVRSDGKRLMKAVTAPRGKDLSRSTHPAKKAKRAGKSNKPLNSDPAEAALQKMGHCRIQESPAGINVVRSDEFCEGSARVQNPDSGSNAKGKRRARRRLTGEGLAEWRSRLMKDQEVKASKSKTRHPSSHRDAPSINPKGRGKAPLDEMHTESAAAWLMQPTESTSTSELRLTSSSSEDSEPLSITSCDEQKNAKARHQRKASAAAQKRNTDVGNGNTKEDGNSSSSSSSEEKACDEKRPKSDSERKADGSGDQVVHSAVNVQDFHCEDAQPQATVRKISTTGISKSTMEATTSLQQNGNDNGNIMQGIPTTPGGTLRNKDDDSCISM